jgi:shikimate kinase
LDGGDKATIAIIGFMGSGKSTVGALSASRLGMDFIDLDEAISEDAGKSIKQIFASEGEEGFRERETRSLQDQLCNGGKVISCGGGIVLREENVELLRGNCLVFLLRISEEKAVERLAENAGGRPLLQDGERETNIRRLMTERAQKYMRAAHIVIEVDDKSPEELAEEIEGGWNAYT